MKRLVLIAVFLAVAVSVFAGDFYSATYTFADNAAVSIATAYAGDNTAPTLPTDKAVKSVTLYSETNGLRWGFRQTPVAGSVGVPLVSGASGKFEGESAYVNAKICPATAGSYPTVHIIVEY
jgi:hypothetical protein